MKKIIALILLGAWSITMALTNDDPINSPYQPATYPKLFDNPQLPPPSTPTPPTYSRYQEDRQFGGNPPYTPVEGIDVYRYQPPPATTQEIAAWMTAIQNRNVTTPPPASQPDTFSGFSSGQSPFQPTGQETQPYFDAGAPLPYAPPVASQDIPNYDYGLIKTANAPVPSVPMNLGAGNTGWFNPQDPHPEVAFAKKHFDTAGWSMQDWIRNSMQFYDANDKNYYFRDGSPYNAGQWNGGKQPFSSGGFGGGAPRGSTQNPGGQGSGVGSGQGGSPVMVGAAAGLPPVSAPMAGGVLPTNGVSVAGDLTQLEIPDELWALIPEQLRGTFGNALMQWLRSMGYSGKGSIGRYGERSYQRPSGQTGNVWFTPEMFNAFSDPEIAKWAKWLLGEKGFSARTSAPEGASPTPPQG